MSYWDKQLKKGTTENDVNIKPYSSGWESDSQPLLANFTDLSMITLDCDISAVCLSDWSSFSPSGLVILLHITCL